MATDDEKQALISNFVNITSSSKEEAQFYLESHNFQIDSAIQSFFENEDSLDSDPLPAASGPQVAAAAAVSSAVPTPQPSVPYPVPASTSGGGSRSKSKKTKRSGGIRTLADLKSGSGSDSDEEGPQEYYTGGEKSGMLVQDPTRRGNQDIDSLFEQARQMGAQQGPFEHEPTSSSRSFTGTGRLLSGETVAAAAPQPPESVIYNIYFWQNGFTVDDGPLRRFDDPANASFLESIRKSECPKELEPADKRIAVNVNLRRMPENYTEPKKQAGTVVFQGTGRTLGSGSSSSSTPAQSVTFATHPVTSAPVIVDDSKPSTSIQLRLADGSRTIGRFNTDHTVGDIRSYINNHMASSGRVVAANYTLQTVGFPPKKLEDDGQTIEQAGLANSVVIQKL